MLFSNPRSSSRFTAHIACATTALSLTTASALAQPTIRNFTIDCGGDVSTGGTLRLTSSIGQPDAAPVINAVSLRLRGGFLTPHHCTADFNGSGDVTADDIFAFLDAWFIQNGLSGPNLSADFDASGTVTADDIFAFLDCWFAAPSNLGC